MKWLANEAAAGCEGGCENCSGICKQLELFPKPPQKRGWLKRLLDFILQAFEND